MWQNMVLKTDGNDLKSVRDGDLKSQHSRPAVHTMKTPFQSKLDYQAFKSMQYHTTSEL
jgi:hypothetical protein